MGYILITEAFEVVDGPYRGKKYVRGKEYADIPANEKHRFTETPAAAAKLKPQEAPQDPPKKDGSDDSPKLSRAASRGRSLTNDPNSGKED